MQPGLKEIHGLCYQKASQAYGEEEAPQVASQDSPPASQQEIGFTGRLSALTTDESG
jgi:hypothetical protein